MNIQEVIEELKKRIYESDLDIKSGERFILSLESKLQEIYQQGRKDMKEEVIEVVEKYLTPENCKCCECECLCDVKVNDINSSLTKLITMDYPDICVHGLDRKDCKKCSE